MERTGLTVGRVVLIVAATAATVGLLNAADAAAPAWIAAAVLLLATGLIVNRVWAAALPFAVTLPLAAFTLIAYRSEDVHELTWETIAAVMAALAAGISLCLLIGVGLRRLARRGDKETRAT